MLAVKFFAQARELVGSPQIEISWTDGQTVSELKQALVQSYPNLSGLISRLLVAVNNEYANDNLPLKQADEVACFPPVSGG